MLVSVTNESKKVVIAPRVKVAASLLTRFWGLLGTSSLPAGEGLWIKPCGSVHTFFMKYPIDVAFLDDQSVILATATLAPWKVSKWVWRSAGVIELPAGTLQSTQTVPGDRLRMEPN